ncbi:MAG: hypothetical protein EOM12_13975 [Verrucomicrobiae bacterium]|nr:hypothetical protein [Verrucomicrobiae bacterium]
MSRDLETWEGSVLDDDGNLPWERADYGRASDYEDHYDEDVQMTKVTGQTGPFQIHLETFTPSFSRLWPI